MTTQQNIYYYIVFLILSLFILSTRAFDTRSNNDISIILEAKCLKSNKILLGSKNIDLTIKLNQYPQSPINITFVSNNNYENFNVDPKFLIFESQFNEIELSNNTFINVENENNYLSKTFTLIGKKQGSSSLHFKVQSDNINNIKLDENLKNGLNISVNAFSISSIIILAATGMFLFSIGLSLSGNTLRGTFNRERIPPIVCGLCCQFVIMPILSFLIAKLFKRDNYQTFSVFLVGISPSSIIAPIFTYYLGGDRALAVSLCLLSTILGSGVYIVYIFIYFTIFGDSLQIAEFPYASVACIVVYWLIALLFGSLILHFKPLWASWLKKGTTFWGAVIIVTSLVTSLKDYTVVFYQDLTIYLVSIVLMSLSFTAALIMSKIFNLDSKKTRAICMNTALPNIPLAITIIQVYLIPCCAQVLSVFPLFHTFWMLVEAIFIGVIIYFFFPEIETINETSEQELANIPSPNSTEGLTIITPHDEESDDSTNEKHNSISISTNTNNKSRQKRESYHKKKISNSTIGLIGKDENDPNIEYLDNITSSGDDDDDDDDDYLTSDTNLANLVVPTTIFSRESYAAPVSTYSVDGSNSSNNYLSPNTAINATFSNNKNNNNKEISNNNVNNISNNEKPRFIRHKANDSTVLDNIKKSDMDSQIHKRSYSFQANNISTFNKNDKEKLENDDDDIDEETPSPSSEFLKANTVDLLNPTVNRFSPGNSPKSGTPSINSMNTKTTQKGKAKSIANTYISNTTTLRPTKTTKMKSPESEINTMSPNFRVNDPINLSMISETSQNSTVIQNNEGIKNTKKVKEKNISDMDKPSLESITTNSESLFSAVESAISSQSNSSSLANTTINPNNLNVNSLLSSDIGNSYLKTSGNEIKPEKESDDNNISLASKIFGMAISQAVSCYPEPIKIEGLKNNEDINSSKDDYSKRENSILSPVSVNSKFSFDNSSFITNNKDNDNSPMSPDKLNNILDELKNNNNIKEDNDNDNNTNNTNKGKSSKPYLFKSLLNQHLTSSASSAIDSSLASPLSPQDKLILSIPKKPYSSVDTNELNSATTFCTTKTTFSSPNSSNLSSAKDNNSNNNENRNSTNPKLKKSDLLGLSSSPPMISNSLDVPKPYLSPYQRPMKATSEDENLRTSENGEPSSPFNRINHHRYKSSTTSFFNSLDGSIDFQSYTESIKDDFGLSNNDHENLSTPYTSIDNISLATSNKHSSYSSALTSAASPYTKLKMQSTAEPEEYIIPQPPEFNIENVDMDEYKYNPQRISVLSGMSYTTFKSCQTEMSEYQDCIPDDKANSINENK